LGRGRFVAPPLAGLAREQVEPRRALVFGERVRHLAGKRGLQFVHPLGAIGLVRARRALGGAQHALLLELLRFERVRGERRAQGEERECERESARGGWHVRNPIGSRRVRSGGCEEV
jgi:hypothetical protein